MKLADVIQLHNERLNRAAAENVFLGQRLKAYIKNRQHGNNLLPRLLFRRPVLVYGLLLIVFTILNFIIIGSLRRPVVPPAPETFRQPVLTLNAFSPAPHGSISHAYTEVMNENR